MTNDDLVRLFEQTQASVEEALKVIEIAEDEIAKAATAHPEAAPLIQDAFGLLKPTHPLLTRTDWSYRSHVAELLARVVAGDDTRPGTAAEAVCACSDISLRTPMNTVGAGLYFRMWTKAGFPSIDHGGEHYEAIERDGIDRLERDIRRKLAQPWRVTVKGRQARAA